MNLAVDVDGVLREIHPTILAIYKRDYDPLSKAQLTDIKTWDIRDSLPKFPKDDVAFWNKHAQEIFYKTPPIPGAIEGLKRFSDAGHYITIATHQCKGLEYITAHWLNDYGVPYDYLYFGKDKSKIPSHVLIDDGAHNLRSFPGVGVLYERPWSGDWMGIRMKDWHFFNDIVAQQMPLHRNKITIKYD